MTLTFAFSLNIYFMYNINIFEHIQDMCLLHYNIIQWDSEESQLTYEVRLPPLPLESSTGQDQHQGF